MRWGRRRQPRRPSEEGAVVVEFALVVPLLLLLVFGIADFGWLMNRDMLVDNSSRDGVRVASLGGTFAEVCTSVKTELSQSGVPVPANCNTNVTPTKITIDCIKVDGTACSATSSTYDGLAVSGATAVVTVTYVHRWITPLTSSILGSTKTIVEKTQMVVE
jgi:Flp pilus assembly protein TadG